MPACTTVPISLNARNPYIISKVPFRRSRFGYSPYWWWFILRKNQSRGCDIWSILSWKQAELGQNSNWNIYWWQFYQMREQYNNIEPLVFRLVTSVGQGKILSPHEESNLRYSNSALQYTVLPLSHRDSTKFIWHASCILLGSAMLMAWQEW